MASTRYSSSTAMDDEEISPPSSYLLEKDVPQALWFRSWNNPEAGWWRPIAIHATIFCAYTLVLLGLGFVFLSKFAQPSCSCSEEHLVYCESFSRSSEREYSCYAKRRHMQQWLNRNR